MLIKNLLPGGQKKTAQKRCATAVGKVRDL